MRKIAITAVLAFGIGLAPFAAYAQATAAPVTQAQVVAACTVADNADQCKALIAAFVALYPVGSVQAQQAIADLVVALASTPAASDPALAQVVAVAINEVAALSPDPTQRAQIVAIAKAVSDGTVQTAAIVVNRPASP